MCLPGTLYTAMKRRERRLLNIMPGEMITLREKGAAGRPTPTAPHRVRRGVRRSRGVLPPQS